MTEAENASSAFQKGEYLESLEIYQRLTVMAERLGLTSSTVQWGVAVGFDMIDDVVAAFQNIRKAFAMDPFNPNIQTSFNIITGKTRAQLTAAEPTDESIPELYGMLQRADELDLPCHLAMANHYVATEQLAKAAGLLEAVTVTSPASCDAWLERARVARLMGNDVEAAEWTAEAAVRERDSVPFGIRTSGGES